MKDNVLTLADMRSLGTEEPMTPEGALMVHQPPLLVPPSIKAADRVVYMRRLTRLAREYLVDYDLMRASARADIPWELVRQAERDPVFIVLVQQMQEELKPEEIITRQEVLLMLKREAYTAAKSRDRVAAMQVLAKVAGFTEAEDDKTAGSRGGAPIINLTFNGLPPPQINVTPSPEHALL